MFSYSGLRNLIGHHSGLIIINRQAVRTFLLSDQCQEKRNFQEIIDQLTSAKGYWIPSQKLEGKYYFEDGIRYTYPRLDVFQTRCPREFVGRNIVNYACTLLQNFSSSEVEEYIDNGNIRVNKQIVDQSRRIKFNEHFSFIHHNHEPPVIALQPKILFQDEDILVIDKPPTIPIHPPIGSTRLNTLVGILRVEKNMVVNPLYRIDAATSGLVLMSPKKEIQNKFRNKLEERDVEKKYLAEVIGDFPDREIIVDVPLHEMDYKGIVLVDKVFGKSSRTIFRKLKSKSHSSILECTLVTGRSHQIRVHLQYLGYPIFNDFVYSSEQVFGPSLGKGGDYRDFNPKNLTKTRLAYYFDGTTDTTDLDRLWSCYSDTEWEAYLESNQYNPDLDIRYDDCKKCYPEGELKKPKYRRFMHLHAHSYKTSDYNFSAGFPFWWE